MNQAEPYGPGMRSVIALAVILGLATAACVHVTATPPEDNAGPIAGDALSKMTAIQSPAPGEVRGIVTARLVEVLGHGRVVHSIVLQSPQQVADNNPETSDAIFVAMSGNRVLRDAKGESVEPQVGDELILRGRSQWIAGRPALADPVLLKRVRQQVDLDREVPAFDTDPPADAVAAERYWAARANMRCRVPAGSTVQGGHYGDSEDPFSQIVLLRPDNPLQKRADPFARRVFRDSHPLDDMAETLADNGNGFGILLGDAGLKHRQNSPEAQLPFVNTFDRLTAPVTGVVLRNNDVYVVQVTDMPVFESGLAPDENRPQPVRRTRSQLSVVTYNIENLYDFRDDPFDPNDFNSSGTNQPVVRQNYVPASQEIYMNRVRNLAAQIVQDLESPDLLLLDEVEDQDIGYLADGELRTDMVNNRDGRPDVLQELAAEIVRAGGPLYTMAADRAGVDERGIMCAFLFREDRIRLAAVDPNDVVLAGVPQVAYPGTMLAYRHEPSNPRVLNAVNPLLGVVNSRGPQVACFERAPGSDLAMPAGTKLYAIAVHFKSRPGEFVDQRREQARLGGAIAEALAHFDPNAWIVLGGDLNTFPRPDEPNPTAPADQLGPLYEAGLNNLYDTELRTYPAGAYTYVFQGQAGTLDQIFVSTNFLTHLVEVRPVHINADYSPDSRVPNRRCSDHDPVLAIFEAGE